MAKKTLSLFRRIFIWFFTLLSGLLTINCKKSPTAQDEPVVVMYGVPYVCAVKGYVKQSISQVPINNIEIKVTDASNSLLGTTTTIANGHYSITIPSCLTNLKVTATDIDGTSNGGVFLSNSLNNINSSEPKDNNIDLTTDNS